MTEGIELRQDFAEAYLWTELAHAIKFRLPLWRLKCTTGGMRRALKKLGIPVDEYLEANNEKNLKAFAKNNPEWPLRAWVGLLLEWKFFKYKDEATEPITVGEIMFTPPKRGRPRKNPV